jgi:dolichol-phosphate mannosyltransferase
MNTQEQSQDHKPLALSVLIPVYNEADNVIALFNEVISVLTPERYEVEVIFVNDASTDDTLSNLQELVTKNPQLRVLSHKKNRGQSAALITGARAANHPILITLDGDGQNDPADIPSMLDHYLNAKTVVLGNRAKRDDNLLRKISSRVGNRIRQGILHDGCPDTGCSLKVFSREAFLSLPSFNHMHRFLPSLFKNSGLNLVNVPVNHRPRQFGVSKYGVLNRLFVGIHDLIGVRWLLKRRIISAEVLEHDSL